MNQRRGFLLAEALCALALAGVLAVACASALAGARRAIARAEARARSERAGIEAIHVIGAIARDADSVQLLGDTALSVTMRVADGVICARDGAVVTLPPSRGATGRSVIAVLSPIEVGDDLRAFVRDSISGIGRWVAARADSVGERTGEVPCGPTGGFVDAAAAAAARARIVVDSLDEAVVAGAPVRVGRHGRLALYNSGAGEWMLGWRRCTATACGVVQPVAGPLRSPSGGGLLLRAVDGVLEVSVRVPGRDVPFVTSIARTDAGR